MSITCSYVRVASAMGGAQRQDQRPSLARLCGPPGRLGTRARGSVGTSEVVVPASQSPQQRFCSASACQREQRRLSIGAISAQQTARSQSPGGAGRLLQPQRQRTHNPPRLHLRAPFLTGRLLRAAPYADHLPQSGSIPLSEAGSIPMSVKALLRCLQLVALAAPAIARRCSADARSHPLP